MVEETKDDNLQEEVVEEVEPEGEVAAPELTIDERVALMQLQFEEKREADKRHFQSVTDQQVGAVRQQAAQSERRAQFAEQQLFSTQAKQFESLDPEQQETQRTIAAEVQRQMMGQQQAAQRPPYTYLPPAGKAMVSQSGLDSTDSRLDWQHIFSATTEEEGMRRLYQNLEQIKGDEAAKKEESVQQSLAEAEERLKSEKPERSTVQVEMQGASGRKAKSFEEIEHAYAVGEISTSEYEEEAKKLGKKIK